MKKKLIKIDSILFQCVPEDYYYTNSMGYEKFIQKAEIVSQNSGVYFVDGIHFYDHRDWDHQKPTATKETESIWEQILKFPYKIKSIKITIINDRAFEGQKTTYRKEVYICNYKNKKRPAMPGAGRPKKPDSERKVSIGTRVTPSFKKDFLELSKDEKMSLGELIEVAIPFFVNYRKQHPKAFERYLEKKDNNSSFLLD